MCPNHIHLIPSRQKQIKNPIDVNYGNYWSKFISVFYRRFEKYSCAFLGPEHALLELMHSQGMNAPDFKGEALTFKATTSGVLETLAHCLELVSQREEGWRKRLERETERRKRVEDLYKHVKVEAEKKQKVVVRGGPDFEVGKF